MPEQSLTQQVLAVAVSGGVDSLFALKHLKEQGHTVFALHALFLPDTPAQQENLANLATLCQKLGVKLHIVNLVEQFHSTIIAPFAQAYFQGLTPNPCALCNRDVKFGLLLEHAQKLGANRLVTGHYVNMGIPDNKQLNCFTLPLAALDTHKDQSYFLALTPLGQLGKAHFPLHSHYKKDIIATLQQENLAPAHVKESQDICFIEDNYRHHIENWLPAGSILSVNTSKGFIKEWETQQTVGTHQGLWNYTEGQRKGLGIAWTEPLYVLRKDIASNTLWVAPKQVALAIGCIVDSINFMAPLTFWPSSLFIRTRYRQKTHSCTITYTDNTLTAHFTEAQTLAAPGQIAAFYTQEGCLLGGGLLTQNIFKE